MSSCACRNVRFDVLLAEWHKRTTEDTRRRLCTGQPVLFDDLVRDANLLKRFHSGDLAANAPEAAPIHLNTCPLSPGYAESGPRADEAPTQLVVENSRA